jgi:scyllo-inositol 2-dehydrogenase (NAD+)
MVLKLISAAIIGYGRMGSGSGRDYGSLPKIWNPYSLREAIELAPNMKLKGVCDLNTSAMINLPSEVERFTSYQLMIEIVKPDFVAITTRTQERSAITLWALENGIKMMHLEKPLCSSKIEASYLKSQFSKFEAKFSYGTIRRYLQPYKLVKNLILSGEFGDLKKVVINYGRGELFWTHPHSIDLMLYFIGNYEQMEITDISGETPIVERIGSQINVITDPILNSARLIFDDRFIAEITSEPTSTVSILFSQNQFHIVEDGRKVIQIDEHGNAHLLWDEKLVNLPAGYSNVLREFNIENLEPKTGDSIGQAMEDAFKGQGILFDMCIKLAEQHLGGVMQPEELKFLAISSHGLLA